MANSKRTTPSSSTSSLSTLSTSKQKRKRNHRDDLIEPIIQKGKVSIRRTGKVVRSYLCQKLVRKLKQCQDQLQEHLQEPPPQDEQDKQDKQDKQTTLSNKIQEMEHQLGQWKTFNLEKLVQQCSQKLHLDSYTTADPSTQSTSTPHLDISPLEQTFLSQMLPHKLLQTTLSTLQTSLETHLESQKRRVELQCLNPSKKKRKKEELLQRREERQLFRRNHGNNRAGDYSGSSGLFIASLAGAGNDDNDHQEEDPYGDEGYTMTNITTTEGEEDGKRKRKNRKGSRARRAKAMAIQARNEGRSWETSMNWRPKKDPPHNEATDTNTNTILNSRNINNVKASEVANTGKDWKDDGTAHPSWLAAQRQKKEGIVAFAGTKITFD